MLKLLSILCVLFLYCANSLVAQTEYKLLAADGSAGDIFGDEVAVSGNFAVVGSPEDDDNGTGSGAAYIYFFNGTSWSQQQKLVPSTIFPGDNFGNSVALYGNTAVVGAKYNDANGSNSGIAYVFRYNGTLWVEETALSASDPAIDDEFGFSVAIDSNVIVVGAYRNDGVASNAGAAYVFSYNTSVWTLNQKLTASDGNVDDFFGYSLAIYTNVIIVGAYLDDDYGVNSGSAYVYRRTGSSFLFEQKLTPINGAGGDAFGFSVSINQNIIVVGAYAKDFTYSDQGSVYVYRHVSSWTLETELFSSDGTQDDWFGFDVSVSGKFIAVGCFHKDDLGSESGASYLFSNNGSIWIEELKREASDGTINDQFGECLSIDGYTLICGALNDDDNGLNSGSAYIYDLCSYHPPHDICLVTVDSASQKNLITWKTMQTSMIDTFLVYRTTFSDFLIASIPYGTAQEYLDVGSNPWQNADDYSLVSVNNCDVESSLSTTNTTIHLETTSDIGFVDLNWTPAEGFSFPYYHVWRDTGTGNYQLLAATLSTQLNFTDNSPPVSTSLNYLVEIEHGSFCTPSWSSSISNISNPYTVGINSISSFENIHFYPNPASNEIHIEGLLINNDYHVCIADLSGRLLFSNTISTQSYTLNLPKNYSQGCYLLTITTNDSFDSFQKLILLY